jgi:hypothetical protein
MEYLGHAMVVLLLPLQLLMLMLLMPVGRYLPFTNQPSLLSQCLMYKTIAYIS